MIIPNAHADVLYYLLERGLLDYRTVVDGNLIVSEISRRHRNFAVIAPDANSYFVKQVNITQPIAVQTLQREAAFYSLVWIGGAFPLLNRLIPKFYVYDSTRQTLVLEFIAGAEDFATYHSRLRQLPKTVASKLGEALGAYHAQCRTERLPDAYRAAFSYETPWVLSFHEHNPASILNLSPANAQFMSILKQYTGFKNTLERLRASWRPVVLIHGDIKFDNLLVCEPNGVDDASFKIVDWEICSVGDPCWDAGSVIQAYLTWWISSIPLQAGSSLERGVAEAAFPLDAIKPAMEAFWRSYVLALGSKEKSDAELLERCVSCAAARMLQTVFESMATASQLSSHVILMLQASLNILQNPTSAATELLQIRRKDAA